MSSNRKLILLPFVLAAAVYVVLGILRLLPLALPYAGQKALDSLRFSQVFLDSDGNELQDLPLADGMHRIFVPLDQTPTELLDIVVQAEDRRFWIHPGFDPAALGRAIFQNSASGERVSGASTISMQLARILNPRPRTGASKVAEIWEALQLESRLGKGGVIELYLNLVPFGHNVEGFGAAARIFYGKPLSQLTRAQLLTLAVVPRSPENYNPSANAKRNAEAVSRLPVSPRESDDRMARAYASAKNPDRTNIWPFRTPQFIRWLSSRPEVATSNGRTPLQTEIEAGLQAGLEQVLASTVEEARGKRVSNAAGLFVRPDTMGIVAWVGSIDFFDNENEGQIDGVTMLRQPGSTLKPFLYSMALEKGFTASTILPDIPSDFGGAEVYTPADFNEQYNGPVRLRQALTASLNIPAVYLLERIGVSPFVDQLLSLGFTSLQRSRGSLGLGLALGNAEVSLFELVHGFSVFANDGVLRDLVLFRGDERGSHQPKVTMTAGTARLIRDILLRHPDRVLTFGHDGNTQLRFDGVMKTGTSNQFNNIWAIGFTSDLLGGVWMGNFEGQTVVGTADSGYPAGALGKMLEKYSKKTSFPPLDGFSEVRICSLSGMKATDDCPYSLTEYFRPGTEPAACSWHIRDAGHSEVRYPQEYQTWKSRYRYAGNSAFQELSTLSVRRPLDRSVFYIDPGTAPAMQQFAIEAQGSGRANITVDGRTVYKGTFPVRIWQPLVKGSHVLRVEDQSDLKVVNFEVK